MNTIILISTATDAVDPLDYLALVHFGVIKCRELMAPTYSYLLNYD